MSAEHAGHETTALLADGVGILAELHRRDSAKSERIALLEKAMNEGFRLRVKLEDRITDLERRLADAEAAAS